MWQNEFSADYAVPEEIQKLVEEGVLEDHSWHNDVCPSFVRAGSYDEDGEIWARLWIEHPDPALREWDTAHRFTVVTDEYTTLYEGDDIHEALKALPEVK